MQPTDGATRSTPDWVQPHGRQPQPGFGGVRRNGLHGAAAVRDPPGPGRVSAAGAAEEDAPAGRLTVQPAARRRRGPAQPQVCGEGGMPLCHCAPCGNEGLGFGCGNSACHPRAIGVFSGSRESPPALAPDRHPPICSAIFQPRLNLNRNMLQVPNGPALSQNGVAHPILVSHNYCYLLDPTICHLPSTPLHLPSCIWLVPDPTISSRKTPSGWGGQPKTFWFGGVYCAWLAGWLVGSSPPGLHRVLLRTATYGTATYGTAHR